MDLAHGNAVGHDRLASLGVGQNVGGVEESRMAETANGAPVLIGDKNSLPEERLVQASLHHSLGVGADEVRVVQL
jgi:hypothetical protein